MLVGQFATAKQDAVIVSVRAESWAYFVQQNATVTTIEPDKHVSIVKVTNNNNQHQPNDQKMTNQQCPITNSVKTEKE